MNKTEFKWSRQVQDELTAINKFIENAPDVKTIWLENKTFDLLFTALKYPEERFKQHGIPYDGRLIKCINFYGIKGSQ